MLSCLRGMHEENSLFFGLNKAYTLLQLPRQHLCWGVLSMLAGVMHLQTRQVTCNQKASVCMRVNVAVGVPV